MPRLVNVPLRYRHDNDVPRDGSANTKYMTADVANLYVYLYNAMLYSLVQGRYTYFNRLASLPDGVQKALKQQAAKYAFGKLKQYATKINNKWVLKAGVSIEYVPYLQTPSKAPLFNSPVRTTPTVPQQADQVSTQQVTLKQEPAENPLETPAPDTQAAQAVLTPPPPIPAETQASSQAAQTQIGQQQPVVKDTEAAAQALTPPPTPTPTEEETPQEELVQPQQQQPVVKDTEAAAQALTPPPVPPAPTDVLTDEESKEEEINNEGENLNGQE